MLMKEYVVGLDVGTMETKAKVFNREGKPQRNLLDWRKMSHNSNADERYNKL